MVYAETPVPIEVAPWVHVGAGVRSDGGDSRFARGLGAGAEATFRFPSSETRPSLRWRTGPWVGLDSSHDRTRIEGGLALNLAGSRVTSLSAWGLRIGIGQALTGETDIVSQLSWGTRFVGMRRWSQVGERPCPACVAPASGLRLFVAARRDVVGADRIELLAGIEWQPVGWGLGMIPD